MATGPCRTRTTSEQTVLPAGNRGQPEGGARNQKAAWRRPRHCGGQALQPLLQTGTQGLSSALAACNPRPPPGACSQRGQILPGRETGPPQFAQRAGAIHTLSLQEHLIPKPKPCGNCIADFVINQPYRRCRGSGAPGPLPKKVRTDGNGRPRIHFLVQL